MLADKGSQTPEAPASLLCDHACWVPAVLGRLPHVHGHELVTLLSFGRPWKTFTLAEALLNVREVMDIDECCCEHPCAK